MNNLPEYVSTCIVILIAFFFLASVIKDTLSNKLGVINILGVILALCLMVVSVIMANTPDLSPLFKIGVVILMSANGVCRVIADKENTYGI